MGELEVSNQHPLAQIKGSFKISRKLQELICLVGQSQVFEDGADLFLKMMGIQVNGMQIQRVSECYGEHIEAAHQQLIEKEESAPALADKKNDTVYVMTDGSMVFTREEGWKEMKVGRVFAEKDCVSIQEERNEIVKSHYVCHLGGHQDFFKKFECYVNNYKKKVCIADGAKWIWNWAEDTYPDMIQILDFFHAVEKLGQYAGYQFPDEKKRKRWLHKQKERLLNNGVGQVIKLLEQSITQTKDAEKTRTDVIRYYQNNEERMQYKTFQDAGYIIGSGAIESAHRNVVQHRLKLSGQKWSVKGAQRIVNLRAYQKSSRWDEVVEIIKIAA